MKKYVIIAVIALLVTASWADARPGRGRGMNGAGKSGFMKEFPGYRFYDLYQEDLKLDDKQLVKMEQMDDTFQKERIDMQSKIKYAGLELKKELDQKNLNKTEVLKKQENVQNLRNNMQKRALEYKMDLFNVLNDEQKSNLDKVRQSCMKNGMGMGNGRGSGRGMGNCDGTGRGMSR